MWTCLATNLTSIKLESWHSRNFYYDLKAFHVYYIYKQQNNAYIMNVIYSARAIKKQIQITTFYQVN